MGQPLKLANSIQTTEAKADKARYFRRFEGAHAPGVSTSRVRWAVVLRVHEAVQIDTDGVGRAAKCVNVFLLPGPNRPTSCST